MINSPDFSPIYDQTLAQYTWHPIRCEFKGCHSRALLYAWPADRVLCPHHLKIIKSRSPEKFRAKPGRTA